MRLFNIINKVAAIVRPDIGRIGLLVTVMILSGFAAVLGVAAIIPLLIIFTKDRAVSDGWSPLDVLSPNPATAFAQALGLFVALSILSVLFQAWTQRSIAFFTSHTAARLSKLTFDRFLAKSYLFHLSRDPVDFTKTILSEVSSLVSAGVMAVLNLTASLITLLTILIFLIAYNPIFALVGFSIILLMYLLVFTATKKRIYSLGDERLAENHRRARISQDTFRSIREVKINSAESYFRSSFGAAAERLARLEAELSWLNQLPRFIIECAIVLSIGLGLVILILVLGDEPPAALQVVGVYAIAAMRLLPHGNILFQSISSLQSYAALIDEMYTIYQDPPARPTRRQSPSLDVSARNITLKNVSFRYPAGDRTALQNLTLEIVPGRSYGLIGASGSGKSTLADLLMGLLLPDSGEILIGDQRLDDNNIDVWRAHVGYVAQSISMLNATLRENVAFGENPDEIDDDAVRMALRVANLSRDLGLDDGGAVRVNVRLGADGLRLSGGQLQRLGIARALYRKPSLLVFDEATSALDNDTENTLLTNIANAFPNQTTLHIAHRLSTIRSCDHLVVLEKGKLIAQGTYKSLQDKLNILKEYR